MTINKELYVEKIAEEIGFTKKDTKTFLEGLIVVTEQLIKDDEKIQLTGFLSIEPKNVGVTSGFTSFKKDENGVGIKKPWTKEAHKSVTISIGKGFEDAINE